MGLFPGGQWAFVSKGEEGGAKLGELEDKQEYGYNKAQFQGPSAQIGMREHMMITLYGYSPLSQCRRSAQLSRGSGIHALSLLKSALHLPSNDRGIPVRVASSQWCGRTSQRGPPPPPQHLHCLLSCGIAHGMQTDGRSSGHPASLGSLYEHRSSLSGWATTGGRGLTGFTS